MLKYLRNLRAAAMVVLGVAIGALGVGPALSAALPLYSGPQDPSQLLFYLNTLVNLINQNAAFAGTGTPLLTIGTLVTGTVGSGTAGNAVGVQFISNSEFTTTHSTTTICSFLVTWSYSTTPMYIPFYC